MLAVLCVLFLFKRMPGYLRLQKILLVILITVLYPLIVGFNPCVISSSTRFLPFGVLIQGALGFDATTHYPKNFKVAEFSKIEVNMSRLEVENLIGLPHVAGEFYEDKKTSFYSNSPNGSGYWRFSV